MRARIEGGYRKLEKRRHFAIVCEAGGKSGKAAAEAPYHAIGLGFVCLTSGGLHCAPSSDLIPSP